ncbi:DUF3365 domain-containing protein [Acidobacteriota bacterium]
MLKKQLLAQEANKDKTKKEHSSLLKTFVLIALFWTVFIACFAAWIIITVQETTTTEILAQGRSFFKQIVTTRYWNSLHGGIYVPVTEETQPNPYLDVPHRDVTTKEGRPLTLINPAYMTRQVAELALDRDQVQFHITSLKPIRPGNKPVAWETEALRNFSAKADEYFKWEIPAGKERKFFRYMAPLWTELACLKCHAKQGYIEGDLRGGISVSIPAESILSARSRHIMTVALGSFIIWLFGLSGIFFSFRVTTKEYKKRSGLIERLQRTLNEVKTLKGFIPICSSCKKVRNDDGYWDQIEKYVRDHSEADFSHSICPDCVKKLYPDFTGDKDFD